MAGQTDPKAGGPYFKKLLASLFANEAISEYATPELRTSMWQTFLDTADKHYEPRQKYVPSAEIRSLWVVPHEL